MEYMGSPNLGPPLRYDPDFLDILIPESTPAGIVLKWLAHKFPAQTILRVPLREQ